MRPRSQICVALALALLLAHAPQSRAVEKKANPKETIASLTSLASMGDVHAQHKLGVLHLSGKGGVPQDFKKAAEWLAKAAERRHADAKIRLGELHQRGLGVGKDLDKAAELYRDAVRAGAVLAHIRLGLMYEKGWGVEKNETHAAQLYLTAANAGLADAQASIGMMYHGGKGVTRNYVEAGNWFLLAARQGNARAQNNLGQMFTRGLGVKKDYRRALKWYARAAQQGLPVALLNLGLLHEKGLGTPVNEKEATRLYRLAAKVSGKTLADIKPNPNAGKISDAPLGEVQEAAKNGDAGSQLELALRLQHGKGLKADPVEAARLLRLAAVQRLAPAQHALGRAYAMGIGVPQDYVLAHKWLNLAATKGQREAASLRDGLTAKMTPAQLHDAQQRLAAGAVATN
ncbi:MAG: SEL1-like repeat protein [Alphaproteobacteria bacterium]|nr:SEL1-like repeat protein [Alphaproteobacteria bacterium]